jgi:radical SAM superfamily enzyme YgiQ (UPF0313 family)
MKVLLLQLPIQTHDFFFSNENIPLAPAYLQGIALEQGIDAALLPKHLMCYGSDLAILKSIMDARPDIVGMSCYLWNMERSLFLANQIKLQLPGCTIVLGGPEISPDNGFLLHRGQFDIGVVGEAEEVWKELLQSFPNISKISGLLIPGKGGKYHFTGNGNGRGPLSQWSSPYLRGLLDCQLRSVLWLETVRGCVYRCAYCYYHKQAPRIRTFPVKRILNEVRRAWEQGLKEIVFLDPCFIRRPHVEALLDGIAVINHDRRLQLRAESTVEGIDSGLARKMSKAGFVEIEIGLQSINPMTLRRIHRTLRPEKFLEGVRFLQGHGIKAMVDIIAGLPGDTLSDVCKSIDWIAGEEAYDYLMLYPLSLMPSTELRQRAAELGLVAMPYPPYLLTRGPRLPAQEMCQAFHYYEESMEEDISPLEMPLSLSAESWVFSDLKGLCNQVTWRNSEEVRGFAQTGDQTTYAITISITREVLKMTELWVQVLKDYLEQNPFTLLSVEVPPDVFLEELDPLWHLAEKHRHLADRDYTATHTPYRSFFLFSRANGLIWKWPDPREASPLKLHDGQRVDCRPVCLLITREKKIPPWFLEYIGERYSSPPEIRIWRRPDQSFSEGV